jgi:hypothetical protein
MRNKRRNTNIKILQSQLQDLAVTTPQSDPVPVSLSNNKILSIESEIKGTGSEVPTIKKIKKKGIPKDELINTRRLLTM